MYDGYKLLIMFSVQWDQTCQLQVYAQRERHVRVFVDSLIESSSQFASAVKKKS